MSDLGLYAQGHYRFSQTLAATLGLRAYRTTQDAANAFWRTNAQFVPTQQVYDAPALHTRASGVLPRLGLDWTVSPSVFAYASVAQGEKFAGFNRAAESLNSARVAAQPEKVTTYEIGAKLNAAPQRLRASVAAFYNDYKDYLVSLNGATINGVLVTDSVFLNTGKARTYGMDLEAEQGLSRGISLTGSIEWLSTKFLDFANPSGAAASDFTGHRLPNAPRWSAAFGVKGRFGAPGGSVTGDAWVQYVDPQFIDVANTAALQVPSQT